MGPLRQSALWVLLAICIVLVLESGLEVVGRVSRSVAQVLESPWVTVPNTVPDGRLVHRPNPEHPEHDDRGFRNTAVPDRAEVVALGDSWTYGMGVGPEDAWPQQLAAQSGRTVYNVSYGGYGPVHSLLLWEEVLSLQPTIVVEAVFLGNDLYDAFTLVYNHGQLQELRTPDEALRERIRSAEASESIEERVGKLVPTDHRNEAGEEAADPDRDANRTAVVGWLTGHSNLYAILRRTRFEIARAIATRRQTADDEWRTALAYAARNPGCCHILDVGGFRTVMSGRYRLAALDLGDLRIEEGLAITERVLQRMQAAANSQGIRFLVLVLPTKELVFRDQWAELPDELRLVTDSELAVFERLSASLRRSRIEYVDALPVLRAEMAAGNQPFPESGDGHPNAAGQAALARTIADQVGWATQPRP